MPVTEVTGAALGKIRIVVLLLASRDEQLRRKTCKTHTHIYIYKQC
jgi:hypothetical protein